jgi:ribonuclease Y
VPDNILTMVMLVILAGVAIGFAFVWFQSRKQTQLLSEEVDRLRRNEKEIEQQAERRAQELVAAARRELEQEKDARVLEAEGRLKVIESQIKATEAKVAAADARVLEAEVKARELILKARETAEGEAARAAAESTLRIKQQEERQARREQVLREKEDLLASRELDLTRREKALQTREQQIQASEAKAAELVEAQQRKLEEIAGMTADQARGVLMDQLREEARRASANEAKRIEDEAREEAEKRAKRVIGIAIQRFAGEHVQDRSVTSVSLPNDELKGRIIGREGRNIRALQEATGVDFIVDDTPETIVLSSFDPIRREVARLALEKLIIDGRIHPTRIEEVVAKSQEEVERSMREAAEQATMELQVTRLHPEIVKLLGRLRYRYSYAQNVLRHSVETGFICGLMASELGLNVRQARRAGLLHDIGKAVSHEQEGGHAVVGGQLARKYGEDEVVANAIAAHHDDEPCRSVLGHLVAAADTLSGARPGARREMLESYVRRLEELERLSTSFKGVERAYAIQAGREVRVLVEPSEVSDAESALLAREIAKKIEESMTYPGQIRVTVVRETRAIDYAK